MGRHPFGSQLRRPKPGYVTTAVGERTNTSFEIFIAQITDGTFCEIGVTRVDGQDYIVKMTRTKHSYEREVQVLLRLKRSKVKAGPDLFDYGFVDYRGGYYFVVTEMLWFDLDEIHRLGRFYTKQTQLRLAIGKIRALQRLHENGVVVSDIKNANFCFTRPDSEDPFKVYFVDFGQATFYEKEDMIDMEDYIYGQNLRYDRLSKLNRSRSYVVSPTVRVPYDDLEAFLYVTAGARTEMLGQKMKCFEMEHYEETRDWFLHEYQGVYRIMCETKRSEFPRYDDIVEELEKQLDKQVLREERVNHYSMFTREGYEPMVVGDRGVPTEIRWFLPNRPQRSVA
ncbi:unnamed protein product [Bursaphelenchus okinawaensis]|uniref:Protein kinase domain-containing protein n=1 Tax=Bursaphelenchus okinawaensis TaxID=465554 RepID=A0A811LLB7_9BILA|nr:unnamed protein product [Bursaphelenchus okinawaensis]CAG9123535.1 unnamed protein product [Bursaphelenchus okinawaensis]